MSEDDIQKYRARVPEPSRFNSEIVCFRIDSEPINFWSGFDEPVPMMSTVTTGEFRKQIFGFGGARFWAWTLDGVNPIF